MLFRRHVCLFGCSECLVVLSPRILSLARDTWCGDRSLPMERRRTRVSSVWICERVVFVSSFVSRVLLFQVQCRCWDVFSRPRLPLPLRRVRTVGGEPRCTVTSTPRTMHGMDPHRTRGCLWNVEGGSDQPVPLSRLSVAQGSLACSLPSPSVSPTLDRPPEWFPPICCGLNETYHVVEGDPPKRGPWNTYEGPHTAEGKRKRHAMFTPNERK